jgi:hypothetical protein
MRSPTWISPAIGGAASAQFQNDHEANGDNQNGTKHSGNHGQFTFSEEEKKQFKDDPAYHLEFRRRIEAEVNFLTDMFIVGNPVQKEIHTSMIQQMKDRIGSGHEELKAKLIPNWAPGCRRITPGDGYLETLVQDHVQPVFGEIERLTENSVEMMDGSQHQVDVLVSYRHFAKNQCADRASRSAPLVSILPLFQAFLSTERMEWQWKLSGKTNQMLIYR